MDDKNKDKFCIMPFLHMEIQTQGGVFSCCHSHSPEEVGNLHSDSLESIWKGKTLKSFKENFLNGKARDLKHCEDCFFFESLDATSWRQVQNKNWKLLEDQAIAGEINQPLSLGVRFSNLCNFACRTCKPSTSTGWFRDASFLNPRGEYHKIESTPKHTSVLEQIDPFIDNLQHMYISGGEPLLEEEHYLLLETLLKRNPDIELSYDTNLSGLTFKNWDVVELWKGFKKIDLSASIDGFGQKGEFIRKGLDWHKYLENWNRVKKECPHIRMMMNFTLSIYNMFHVLEFIDEVIRLDMYSDNDPIDLTISLVEDPQWQSIQALPLAIKDELKKRYSEYENLSFGKVEQDLGNAIKYMYAADHSPLIKKFKTFNTKLDLIRAENFQQLFSEEASLLDMK